MERIERLGREVDRSFGAIDVGAIADGGRVAIGGEAATGTALEAGQEPDIVVDRVGHDAVGQLRHHAPELAQQMAHEIDAVDREVDDGGTARKAEVVAVARRCRIDVPALGVDRAEAVHPADHALLDQGLRDAHLVPVALVEAHLQDDAGRGAGLDHAPCRLDVDRERLLAQHVLARGRCRDDGLGVEAIGGGDDHRIDVRPLQQAVELEAGVGAECFGEAARALRVLIEDGHELGIGRAADGGRVAEPHDGTGTDQPEADRCLHGCRSHCPASRLSYAPPGIPPGASWGNDTHRAWLGRHRRRPERQVGQ